MRIIAADVHALDRGSAVVLAGIFQMDDKGAYRGLFISDIKLLVRISILQINDVISIVVDRDSNTGLFSSKRFVVCGCKGQVVTDLLIQLRSNTVVLNILRNFDPVKIIIRLPVIRHVGIKLPSRSVLIFTGRGQAAFGRFVKVPAAVGRRNLLFGCVFLTVYRDGGIVMHL